MRLRHKESGAEGGSRWEKAAARKHGTTKTDDMKRLIIALLAAFSVGLPLLAQQTDTIVERDAEGRTSRVVVLGKDADTLSVTTYVGKDSSGGWYSSVTSSGGNSSGGVISSVSGSFGNSWLHKSDAAEVLVVAVVFFFVFGVPCLVLFLIFYLSYRNRRAKYRLAELALEKGQPLPPGMFEKEGRDLRAKGISNVCLGLGLSVLLSLIGGAVLGSIGLMVLLAGVGQLVIYYTAPGKKRGTQPGGTTRTENANDGSGNEDDAA